MQNSKQKNDNKYSEYGPGYAGSSQNAANKNMDAKKNNGWMYEEEDDVKPDVKINSHLLDHGYGFSMPVQQPSHRQNSLHRIGKNARNAANIQHKSNDPCITDYYKVSVKNDANVYLYRN